MKRILATAALALALGTAQPARAVDVVSARFSLLAFDDDLDSKDFQTRSHLGLGLRAQAPDSGLSVEA